MIVAASGVLNGQQRRCARQLLYKPRAPLSGRCAWRCWPAAWMVPMLDLGRPERVIVALTHYNFTLVFAWNVSSSTRA
ncbi:MAG: hypothetical protein U1F67_21735 [Rubrivivax sp.]